MTADQIRAEMTRVYEQFKPTESLYRQYAESALALSVEYHKQRLAEAFPGAEIVESSVLAVLDARQTPRSLDKTLAANAGFNTDGVKRIIFDPVEKRFFLLT